MLCVEMELYFINSCLWFSTGKYNLPHGFTLKLWERKVGMGTIQATMCEIYDLLNKNGNHHCHLVLFCFAGSYNSKVKPIFQHYPLYCTYIYKHRRRVKHSSHKSKPRMRSIQRRMCEWAHNHGTLLLGGALKCTHGRAVGVLVVMLYFLARIEPGLRKKEERFE